MLLPVYKRGLGADLPNASYVVVILIMGSPSSLISGKIKLFNSAVKKSQLI